MGFPWLNREMKQRLRHSNTMANRSLSRLQVAAEEERFATAEHPYNSWMWCWRQAHTLEDEWGFDYSVGSMCCFEGRREKWYALLGNSTEIFQELNAPACPGHAGLLPYTVRRDAQGRLQFDAEEEAEYPEDWCNAYARGLRRIVEVHGRHQEAVVNGGKCWLMDELEQSTERLTRKSAQQGNWRNT